MARINLTKYGFIRTPEHDFSDDGNRFIGYTLYGVRFSYLKSGGNVFLSGHAEVDGVQNLNYEEYYNLPHFKDIDALNYVDETEITPETLNKLVEDTKAFVEEYTEKAKSVKNPSVEELVAYFKEVKAKRYAEISELSSRINSSIMKMDQYSFKSFKAYFDELIKQANIDENAMAKNILNSTYSRSLIGNYKNNNYTIQESPYYGWANSYLKEIGA